MSPVISVQNLGKKYILSHQSPERYTALRDVIANGAKKTLKKIRHLFAEQEVDEAYEEFWALKDVTFDIQQGDRVGIIGRNGAGKSTLLKILSRITEPTTGQVKIKGQVASLLEVGTGFHPELTGRENIYLNGAILGMSKAEIKKKFDEIVAFAEVEKFLDTPVKRYSSGMYVRLAFAVAAHLESEILIVDEVLAVGDAEFQKKCLGKMQDVGQEGRTVMFVSHLMTAVSSLCNKAIVLDKGKLVLEATPVTAIKRYLDGQSSQQSSIVQWDTNNAPGDGTVKLTSVAVLNDHGEVSRYFDRSEAIYLQIEYVIPSQLQRPIEPQIRIFDEARICVFISFKPQLWINERENSKYRSVCAIPGNLMNDREYFADVYFTTPHTRQIHLHTENVVSFKVNDSERDANFGQIPGGVRPDLFWSTELINKETQ